MAIDKAVNPAPDVEVTVETESFSTPDIEIVLRRRWWMRYCRDWSIEER
jgi:hypothetical protein